MKEFLFHSTRKVNVGNFLKMFVTEICVKRICVNQGLGVHKSHLFMPMINNIVPVSIALEIESTASINHLNRPVFSYLPSFELEFRTNFLIEVHCVIYLLHI